MNFQEVEALVQPVVDALLKEFPNDLRSIDEVLIFNRFMHGDIELSFSMTSVTERDFGKLLGLKCATGVIDLRLEISVVPHTDNSVYVKIIAKP